MPFKSEKQRRYLHINKPTIAKAWERKYLSGGEVLKLKSKKYKRGDAVDTGDFGSEKANDASLSAGNKSVGYGGRDGDPRTGGGVTTGGNKGVKAVTTVMGKVLDLPLTALSYGLKFAKNITTPQKTVATKTTTPKTTGGGEGQQVSLKQPIIPMQTYKTVDTNLINPKKNFFNFKAYNIGGLSGGVRYGPPPKRGPNSQVPPVKMKRGGYKK